jgi:hypothetical protein
MVDQNIRRERFAQWHADLMAAARSLANQASRHLSQPKNAEEQARAAVVEIIRKRLDTHFHSTPWFIAWSTEMLARVDALARAARSNPMDSPLAASAMTEVESWSRRPPGEHTDIADTYKVTVVYRLAPEDSISDILDHHAVVKHASGDAIAECKVERIKAARKSDALSAMARTFEMQQRASAISSEQIHQAKELIIRTLLNKGSMTLDDEHRAIAFLSSTNPSADHALP